MKVKIEVYSSICAADQGARGKLFEKRKNSSSSELRIIFDKNAVEALCFNPVVLNMSKLEIKRPSIDSKKTHKLVNNRVSSAYNIDLVGEYNLIKENEDLFYLEKI